ncbi:MAG: DUF4157 domain-containing protein [Bryobacteraceae bacterium]
MSAGGKIPAWSLAKVNFGQVQRQTGPSSPTSQPTPAPQPNNYEEGAEKLGEAFLQTDIGKKLEKTVTDPLVKGAEDFIGTLPGKIIAGAAATGAVAAMAATHTPLPAQIPEISLDNVRPGLKVKITYEGPVDHPTKAMVTFSYTPQGDKKKPAQTESQRYRAETARLAGDLAKFRAGLKYPPGSPEDLQQKAEQKMMDDWMRSRLGGIPGLGGQPPGPAAPEAQQSGGVGLTLPEFQSPFAPKAPSLLDKKLELKPSPPPAAASQPDSDAKRQEELPVQRKAESNAAVLANPLPVNDALQSAGRPLDRETRRLMGSRFGFDFSKVRIHTDSQAAASAKGIGASAYTHGNDVVFGTGRYAPDTTEGRRLLAHELTHVVQQQNPRQSASGDALGREADQAATDVMAGRHVQIRLFAPLGQPHCQSTTWKSGNVFVNSVAASQILTQGGLFSGDDERHIRVNKGKLEYDSSYTTPQDPFRWNLLKMDVDSASLRISAVSNTQKFKVQEAPAPSPPVDRSISEIGMLIGDPSVEGVTLAVGGQSPNPVFDMIFYDKDIGIGALAHELFGHESLKLAGKPFVHPPPGSAAEQTKGTLRPTDQVTDPFGNVFSGTVREYIDKFIESGSPKTMKTSTGQTVKVPVSPTQMVGVDALRKAFSDLATAATTGLTARTYSAPVAQAWRVLCNNYDLMPTIREAQLAGNSNLLNTKENLLQICIIQFGLWSAAQAAGFRILLADFTGSRAGFTVNELSEKMEAAVGRAPSPAAFP